MALLLLFLKRKFNTNWPKFTTFWGFCKYLIFLKRVKERFFSVALLRRATKSDSLFTKRAPKANRSFALLERGQKSKSLFRSSQKERKSAKRANRSFALFFALFSKKKRDSLFSKKSDCPTLFISRSHFHVIYIRSFFTRKKIPLINPRPRL